MQNVHTILLDKYYFNLDYSNGHICLLTSFCSLLGSNIPPRFYYKNMVNKKFL
jgi:hypothetical protein